MDTQDKLVTKSAPVKAKPKSRNGTGNGGRRNGNGAVNLLEHEIELGQCYSALLGYRNGDFTARLPHTWSGPLGKIAEVMNEIMISSARRASETSRISRVVGEEGKLRERFSSAGLFGGWADEIASLNRLIDDLVSPTAEVTRA
ncbi:MAG: HAMP domain-containing protein, partial [Candidatus Binatia bacterium]